ncbi:MAG: DUF3530 family protein [Shewanella sp.]
MGRFFLSLCSLYLSLLAFNLHAATAPSQPEAATNSPTLNPPTLNPPTSRYLPEPEIKQISIDNQPYELLVRPWEGKKKRGASIILPATNGSADAPGFMAFVRRHINAAGWASLSLTPPRELPASNFATAATEIAAAGTAQLSILANKPSPKVPAEQRRQYQLQQEDFVVKSLSQLEKIGAEYPGKRLLITADQSAALLIYLISEQRMALPDVLIVINPYSEDDARNQGLAAALAKLTIPVLDIQSPDGHPASLQTAAQRQTLAVTHATPNYRQSLLALNLDNESAWQQCLTTIKGFAARMSAAE